MVDQAQRLREMFQGQQAFPAPKRLGFSRVIVVSSGKGGVGKTNLVVNLAVLMGQAGNKVIILDTDLGMANVDILFSLKQSYNLVDVLRGHKDLDDITLKGPYGIEIVPGGSNLPDIVDMDQQQREQLISQFSRLEKEGSIMLVDCPAGLSRNVLSFIAAGDDLLLVTTPEPTAIADAYSIIKVVAHYKLKPNINLVLNMVRSVKQGESAYYRLENVCRSYLNVKTKFLGCIEFDEHVHKAVLNCSPYVLQFPRSQASRHMREIARNLLHEKTAPPAPKKGGFLNRFLQFLK
ncbi:MAG: MinD/ParA family protein [Dethiobacteria bacterium]|jgi:flagellar biosynthesis protein FlhG